MIPPRNCPKRSRRVTWVCMVKRAYHEWKQSALNHPVSRIGDLRTTGNHVTKLVEMQRTCTNIYSDVAVPDSGCERGSTIDNRRYHSRIASSVPTCRGTVHPRNLSVAPRR